MFEKIIKNPLLLSVVAVILVVAAVFVYLSQEGRLNFAGVLSSEKVGEIVVDYINKNADLGGDTASLIGAVEESGVYKTTVGIADQEYVFYVSKDGKMLFPEVYILETEESSPEETSLGIPKRERPGVKLFVMSYCPYGLQMQKAYLPVYDLLKDKADMGVYFVNYAMHDKVEIDENLRQYCIQKEEKEKYADYLSCFTVSGDTDQCAEEAGISQAKLQNCFFEIDRDFMVTAMYNNQDTWLQGTYPQFSVEADLNEQYGVQGSPTLVINDSVIVSRQDQCPGGDVECVVVPDFDRSPENLKNIICQAFDQKPGECSQTLSEDIPSAGFGGGTGSSGSASCQ